MCFPLLAYYYRIYLYHTLTVIVVPDHPDGATRVDDQHFGLVLVSILGFGHRVAPSAERLRWRRPKIRLRRCGPKIRRRRRGQTPKRLRNVNFNGMSVIVGHADRGQAFRDVTVRSRFYLWFLIHFDVKKKQFTKH